MDFAFYKDEKVAIWRRTYLTVEAETKEEADKIVKADPYNLYDDRIEMVDSELLYETEEELQSNEGNPTIEIYDFQDKIIFYE